MRAAVIVDTAQLAVKDIPQPVQDGKSIITKVLRTGICGSDISIWKSGAERYRNLVLGHEYCLEVVDSGPSSYKIGERIIGLPTGGCLFCEMCEKGLYCHCLNRKPNGDPYADAPGVRNQGAYAEYLKIRPELTYRVPDTISSDVATLMEPLSFAFNCVNRVIERDGGLWERVLITGCGIIAVLIGEILRSKGVGYIAMTEINPFRGRHAMEAGVANELFDPTNSEDMEKLAKSADSGFDVGFECTGKGPSLDLLCNYTKRRGTILQAGISFSPISFLNLTPVTKELTIIFAYGSPGQTIEEALHLAAQINERLEKHITYPNVSLDGAQEALKHLASGETSAIKLVIDPHKSPAKKCQGVECKQLMNARKY